VLIPEAVLTADGYVDYNRLMDIYVEFRNLLKSLNAHEANYAVCGGFAVAFHEYVRATKDIVLLVHHHNIDSLVAIAAECGFDPCDDLLRFGIGTDRETAIKRLNKFVGNDFLTLDLILVNSQTESAWRTRLEVALPNQNMQVVSLAGLATMKRLAGRTQDLLDLEKLGLNES